MIKSKQKVFKKVKDLEEEEEEIEDKDHSNDDDDDDEDDVEEQEKDDDENENDDEEDDEEEEEEDDDEDHQQIVSNLKADVVDYAKEIEQSGVIYISRLPPFMKPQKVRHLFSEYGEVRRIYLTPERKSMRKARLASGGSRSDKYLDGWIEFADKRIAKAVALSLNNTQLGGKRRSMYYDMIWNVKYLSGFKWHQLTEKIAYDRAVREQRLQHEISAVKRETTAYMKNSTQAQKLEAMRRAREKRVAAQSDSRMPSSNSTSSSSNTSSSKISTTTTTTPSNASNHVSLSSDSKPRTFATTIRQRPVVRSSMGVFDASLLAHVVPQSASSSHRTKRTNPTHSQDKSKKIRNKSIPVFIS